MKATMGCFVKQISFERLDIGIVSIRWAVKLFLNLKVIKGPSIFPHTHLGGPNKQTLSPVNLLNTLVVQ
jgi:hypothetical protein